MCNDKYRLIVTVQDFMPATDDTYMLDSERKTTRLFCSLSGAAQEFDYEITARRAPIFEGYEVCGKVELFKIGMKTPIETYEFGAIDLFMDL